MDRKELIDMRDTFMDIANTIDELIILSDREEDGEDVKNESELVLGKFMVKMLKLSKFDG